MNYVDGFVLAVPTENKDAYVKHASLAADVFKEYGSLSNWSHTHKEVTQSTITTHPRGSRQTRGAPAKASHEV